MHPCSSLLALQWKQDSETSADFIKKALEVDDKCEFAYETLGTIEVQRYVWYVDSLGPKKI